MNVKSKTRILPMNLSIIRISLSRLGGIGESDLDPVLLEGGDVGGVQKLMGSQEMEYSVRLQGLMLTSQTE